MTPVLRIEKSWAQRPKSAELRERRPPARSSKAACCNIGSHMQGQTSLLSCIQEIVGHFRWCTNGCKCQRSLHEPNSDMVTRVEQSTVNVSAFQLAQSRHCFAPEYGCTAPWCLLVVEGSKRSWASSRFWEFAGQSLSDSFTYSTVLHSFC